MSSKDRNSKMEKRASEMNLNQEEIYRKKYDKQKKGMQRETKEDELEIDYFCQECENARQVKHDNTTHNILK